MSSPAPQIRKYSQPATARAIFYRCCSVPCASSPWPTRSIKAKVAALAALGTPQAYSEVPWFWSDQYDLKLQIAGLSQGYDRVVVRGEPTARTFAAYYLANGIVIAVDAVNSPRDFANGRKLVAARAAVPAETLADPRGSLSTRVTVDSPATTAVSRRSRCSSPASASPRVVGLSSVTRYCSSARPSRFAKRPVAPDYDGALRPRTDGRSIVRRTFPRPTEVPSGYEGLFQERP